MAASTSSASPANSAGPAQKGKPQQRISLGTLWALLKETGADWMQDNAMRLSAALALYTILSLAPLLVITIKIVSVVWRDHAQEEVQLQLQNLMGADAAKALHDTFQKGGKPGSGILATVISTAVLLFSATGVFAELQDSMNTIWGVKPKPNQGIWGFVRNRLLSLGMVFGIGFLLLVSMFISTLLTTLAKFLAGDVKWLAFVIDLVISFGVVALLLAAIFKFLPDVKLQLWHVWLGALLTAGLFTVGKYGLALYFKKAAPASAFGAAGSLAAVLLWVYYSAFILFFGAEFTKVYTLHHDSRIIPDDHAVKVTEEDRAQRGIPSEKRMQNAVAGRPLSSKGVAPPPRAAPPEGRGHRFGPVDLAVAAGGLVVGAIAGGAGARYLLDDPRRPARKHLAAVRLDQRLHEIETKLGRVSRIKQYLQDMDVRQRIDEVSRHIRSTATTAQAQATGRPRWRVRLADFVAGR